VSKISRADRVIGALLVVVLLVLAGVAANRHWSGRQATDTAAGATGTTGVTHPPGSPTTAVGQVGTTSSSGIKTAPTTATTSTTTTIAPSSGAPGTAPVPGPVTAVGDSIMLDIQSDLQTDIPGIRVDGLVSRQFETGVGIVQADAAAGTLGKVLVVELGTNGTVTPADFTAMMQAAVGVTRVVFVNVNVPRSWEAEDNAVLSAGVAQYPGVAVLANWNAASTGHPEWFTPDQVHLEPAGAAALATLITSYA
jgi:hypothetical protein